MRPEGSAPSLVQIFYVRISVPQEIIELLPACVAEAYVGALMSDLVIDLPGNYGLLIFIVTAHGICKFRCLLPVEIGIETVSSSCTERLNVASLGNVHYLRMIPVHP